MLRHRCPGQEDCSSRINLHNDVSPDSTVLHFALGSSMLGILHKYVNLQKMLAVLGGGDAYERIRDGANSRAQRLSFGSASRDSDFGISPVCIRWHIEAAFAIERSLSAILELRDRFSSAPELRRDIADRIVIIN